MRIALVSQLSPWDFRGGTEQVIAAQARELARRGHRVQLVAGAAEPAGEGEEPRRDFREGISITVLPRRRDEPYDLELVRPRLAASVEREIQGAERVHLHHWSTLAGDLVRRLSARAPVVVSLHDDFTTCPRFFRSPPNAELACPAGGEPAAAAHSTCARCLAPDAPGLSHEALCEGLARREEAYRAELSAAAWIAVPSRSQAERLSAWIDLPGERLRVVPHGLCRSLVLAPPSATVWSGSGPLRVVHFGNLGELKGGLDLTCALALQRPGRVELELCGNEAEAGFVERCRELAPDLAIRWSGPYDGRALVARCARADLAAFPSRAWESYGLVVDEALAMGLPVWVSDRGAPAERVGSAGRVLPAGDPAAWAAAFAELLERPELLERQRRAIPAPLRSAADAARELEVLYRMVS